MNKRTITLDFLVNETQIEIEILKFNILELLQHISDKGLKCEPGVYCFYDKKEIYIGESTIPFYRLKEHSQCKNLNTNHIVILFRSEKFNRSVIYDIETKLIEFMLITKNKLNLKNKKTKQKSHNYLFKEEYVKLIEPIWNYLQEEGISKYDINDLFNQDIFKFSPYKSLNADQFNVVKEIQNDRNSKMILVKGYPGTGKSVVASTLYEKLSEIKSVALVSGTKPVHNSFVQVFKYHKKICKTYSKVLRPKDIINNNDIYDVIIVDEAHRLVKLGCNIDGRATIHLKNNNYNNDLEGLIEKCKKIVLFHDENQIVHPAGITLDDIKKLFSSKISKTLLLKEQMRSYSGYKFISYIINSISGEKKEYTQSDDYDYKIFTSFKEMYYALKKKSEDNELVRLVSGNTRERKSKYRPEEFDFKIDGINLRWNTQEIGWIQTDSAKSLKEVGYYNSVQGFDLIYCGVIIGRDIYLDDNDEIKINEKFVLGRFQKPIKNDPNYYEKLKTSIINKYKILLSRGSKGTYIYVEDEKLRDKLLEEFKQE